MQAGGAGLGAVAVGFGGLGAERGVGRVGFLARREGLAGGFVILPDLFEGGEVGPGGHLFVVLGEHRTHASGGEGFAAHPGLDGGATEGAVYDADGDAEFFLELGGEEVGDGGEIGRVGSIEFFPRIRGHRIANVGAKGDFELADAGVVGAGEDRGGEVGALVETPLHVGLAEAEPDLAEGDVG